MDAEPVPSPWRKSPPWIMKSLIWLKVVRERVCVLMKVGSRWCLLLGGIYFLCNLGPGRGRFWSRRCRTKRGVSGSLVVRERLLCLTTLKFSAVLGVTSAKSSILMRPSGSPRGRTWIVRCASMENTFMFVSFSKTEPSALESIARAAFLIDGYRRNIRM